MPTPALPIAVIYHPLITGNKIDIGQYSAEGYRDIVGAKGGYLSASFRIQSDRLGVEDWLTNGLLRHIEIWGPGGGSVWQGFVNQVQVNLGPVSVTAGPFMDMANQAVVVYSTIYVDDDTGEAITGTRIVTDTADHAESQEKWGVVTKVLSIAGAQEGGAERIRDAYLEAHHEPRISKRISTGSFAHGAVTINCLGYYRMLTYPFYSTTTGTVNASTKLSSVLAASPNSWLSFDTTHLQTNTIQVPAYEQKDREAKYLVETVCSQGDASNNRWTFGIYDDRKVYYGPAPETAEYMQLLSDPAARVTTISGSEVPGYEVLPARWLLIPDMLPGLTEWGNIRRDPRAMFIEERTYDSDNGGVELSGGNTDTLPQVLAQLGLSGVAG